ncbi:unnamed protein product [Protopolystoma xenopodis]|uniref:Uncharacterized protein n=1 Tax=Protopolystoma xenopodis TaxID=117903 RepID=A0A3S5AD71_9PLAT|nr:unnamed protein product [Protopolystoma xenopodis]
MLDKPREIQARGGTTKSAKINLASTDSSQEASWELSRLVEVLDNVHQSNTDSPFATPEEISVLQKRSFWRPKQQRDLLNNQNWHTECIIEGGQQLENDIIRKSIIQTETNISRNGNAFQTYQIPVTESIQTRSEEKECCSKIAYQKTTDSRISNNSTLNDERQEYHHYHLYHHHHHHHHHHDPTPLITR